MLIKIDHICLTCRQGEEDQILKKYPEYKIQFQDIGLKNLDIKRELMERYSEIHDISYLSKDNAVPLEITAYPEISLGKNNVKFIQDSMTLEIQSNNVLESKSLFELCGARFHKINAIQADGTLKGLFDKYKLNIRILHSEAVLSWKLDAGDVSALAVVVKDIDYEQRKLGQVFNVTSIRKLEVNKKVLKIFFAWRDKGEIIEFISL